MDALVFALDRQRFGVPADEVVEIVRAAAVRRVPGAPPIVLGALDVRGTLTAVIDLRARFGLPLRPIDLDDHFVVLRTRGKTGAMRTVAFVTDRAESLLAIDEATLGAPSSVSPHAMHITGIATTPDGMVMICDVASFLTEAEEHSFRTAVSTAPATASSAQ